MSILYTLSAAFIILLLCLAGIGIKVLTKKRGEFKRQCSNIDPYTGKGRGCICASDAKNKNSEASLCNNKRKHPYQPLDINAELLKEIN
ncbi:MAG: hypothetical protein J6X58_03905 [Bacteroidales bacterium]|nr:hypothetical protein [Bacteroidales bacterium]